MLLGCGLILVGVVLFGYRKLVQDRVPLRWREEPDPTAPSQARA
ncbi:Uncharacterised protein [Mycobacteroides abscessus subsp. abscessus]|nr:Uncharacterised protein [Mycobacteroides abscessus subsp. abscessus]